jgi:polyisoprenoid-binding protein YceI
MSTNATSTNALAVGSWELDPSRSSVEFHVRHFYGLLTVKGRFDRYEGRLDLSGSPALCLEIEAASLETNNKQRDKHLRSNEFFDVAHHPHVRFTADTADYDGDALMAHGQLSAAGKQIPVEVHATVTPAGDEFVIEATATVDHTQLGMRWSPLGILRTPSKLIVRGRLTRQSHD